MYELLVSNSSFLKDFFIMDSFKFQKTVLAVSTTAAMAGMLVGGQAFAALPTNEQASIEVTSKIVTST